MKKDDDIYLRLYQLYYEPMYFLIGIGLLLIVALVGIVGGLSTMIEGGIAEFVVFVIYVVYLKLVMIAANRAVQDRDAGNISVTIDDRYIFRSFDGERGGKNLPAKRMPEYGIVSEEELLVFMKYGYQIHIGDKKRFLWVFYTQDKGREIREFLFQLKLRHEHPPLKFIYYTRGRILIDIELVEGYNYPRSFVTKFNELKERW